MTNGFVAKVRHAIAGLNGKYRKEAADEFERIQSLGVRNTKSLGRLMTSAETPIELRTFGAWLLGRLDSGEAQRLLVAALGQDEIQLRCQAAISLGHQARPESVSTLLSTIENDRDDRLRACCISALNSFDSPQIEELLLEKLNDRLEADEIREHAAEALANYPGHRTTTLLKGVLDEPSTILRYSAVYALGEIGDEQAIPALKRLTESDHETGPYGDTIAEDAQSAIRKIRQRIGS